MGILLQRSGQPHSRANAAVVVKDDGTLYKRLFKNFTRLGNTAQTYAQPQAGGGWAYAGSKTRKTTDKASTSPCTCQMCSAVTWLKPAA